MTGVQTCALPILKDLLGRPIVQHPDHESMANAAEWEDFCDELFRIYQQKALEEVGEAPII